MASSSKSHRLLLLLFCVFISDFCTTSCLAQRTLGFDIHHRFSDKVKGLLPTDGLPSKGTYDYYIAMAHRDRSLHGRRLASTGGGQSPLTFSNGNETYFFGSLGFLHYAFVSVGTPAKSYLVALDTGSDLFWLPCECTDCITQLNSTSGPVKLNIYSKKSSSTGQDVLCSNSLCDFANQCTLPTDTCPYQVNYVSDNTSTTGYLVQDVLHLITDNDSKNPINASITLGCGQVQTGIFLQGAAPNGLFGLGIEDIAVPTVLAKQGLTSNSFSMCFGDDGVGRIEFGDNGTLTQKETPIDASGRHPSYSITITQIIVGRNVSNVSISAIFDTGTSFTYLTDPAYTAITQKFNALIQEKRYRTDPDFPFEFCYEYNQTAGFSYPPVNLTLQGGEKFDIMNGLLVVVSFSDQNGKIVQYLFCLGVVKNEDINLIGQNFMIGYRLVFDREKMVLGWRESDCYSSFNDDETANTPPTTPPPPVSTTPPPSPSVAPPVSTTPPAVTNTTSSNTTAPAPTNYATQSNPINYALLILLSLVLIAV